MKSTHPSADCSALAGRWTIQAAYRGGEQLDEPAYLQFEGCTFQRVSGEEVWQRDIVLDDTHQPKWMTIYPQSDPYRGKTLLGIYKIEGDTLYIAHAAPGKDRPTAFTSPEDTEQVLSISTKQP